MNISKCHLNSRSERYTGRTERVVVVLSAGSDAAPTAQPHKVRLVVRPLVDDKLGEIVLTKTVYVMVIEKIEKIEKP